MPLVDSTIRAPGRRAPRARGALDHVKGRAVFHSVRGLNPSEFRPEAAPGGVKGPVIRKTGVWPTMVAGPVVPAGAVLGVLCAMCVVKGGQNMVHR